MCDRHTLWTTMADAAPAWNLLKVLKCENFSRRCFSEPIDCKWLEMARVGGGATCTEEEAACRASCGIFVVSQANREVSQPTVNNLSPLIQHAFFFHAQALPPRLPSASLLNATMPPNALS
jgi:hypothetical protein